MKLLVDQGREKGVSSAYSLRMLAKERGEPKITFQALFYPATDANFDSQSYIDTKKATGSPRSYEMVLE
jgi:acetyl esterase/lipase